MTPPRDERDDADDEEWRFAVEDVGEDAGDGAAAGEEPLGDAATGEEPADDADGNVFGPRPDEGGPLEPGDPDPEHVLFLVLGVATTLALMLEVVGVF